MIFWIDLEVVAIKTVRREWGEGLPWGEEIIIRITEILQSYHLSVEDIESWITQVKLQKLLSP